MLVIVAFHGGLDYLYLRDNSKPHKYSINFLFFFSVFKIPVINSHWGCTLPSPSPFNFTFNTAF